MTFLIRRDDDFFFLFFFLISDITEFSAFFFFFSGCYTTYEINSICTMYKLCLLITHLLSIFCLFMKTSKAQIIKGLLLEVTDDRTFSFKINEKKSFMS